MSREAYQVPVAVPLPGRGSSQGSGPIEGPAINYLCGDCNAKVPLKRGDPIRCKECGHRVLYKERTKRELRAHNREEWCSLKQDDDHWCLSEEAQRWLSHYFGASWRAKRISFLVQFALKI